MGYYFDIAAATGVIVCVLLGLRRGLIREVFDVVAIVAAVCVVGICEHFGVRLFQSFQVPLAAKRLLTNGVEFVAGLVLVRVAGLLVERLIRRPILKMINRTGGAVVAGLKAAGLIGFALILLIKNPVLGTGWMRQSISLPLFLAVSRAALTLLPQEFAQAVESL